MDTPAPLIRLPDGTVKQRNPFSGTQVWTVPGRGHRPWASPVTAPVPIDSAESGRYCAFCERRHLETPPEIARLLADGTVLRQCAAAELDATTPAFRRVPNLFEILPLSYWMTNHHLGMDPAAEARRLSYGADPRGREHLDQVVNAKLLAEGVATQALPEISESRRELAERALFQTSHELVIAARHFTDGARFTHELAGSGTLSPDEHDQFLTFTADAARELHERNPFAKHVAVFQNWLRPAGASFDHLHKQLAAIDEWGATLAMEVAAVQRDPDRYREWGPDYAQANGLIIAANAHAVAFAGFGHRYPSVEIHSLAPGRPWEQTAEQRRGMSDLLRDMHSATGTSVPCNEEWHYQPVGVDTAMPWRIVLKWRISTLAGFEGVTKINLNTVDPWQVRERILASPAVSQEPQANGT